MLYIMLLCFSISSSKKVTYVLHFVVQYLVMMCDLKYTSLEEKWKCRLERCRLGLITLGCIQMNLNNTLTFSGEEYVVGRVRLNTNIVEQIVLCAFIKEPAPLNCIVLSHLEFIMFYIISLI